MGVALSRHAAGKGRRAEQSARTSLRSGTSPSTLPVVATGSAKGLAQKDQKARVAANEMRADQRNTSAEVAARLAVAGAARSLQRASWRTNPAASALQRPPTSRASTVRRERTGRSATPRGPRSHWSAGALNLVRDLVRLRRLRAPRHCATRRQRRGLAGGGRACPSRCSEQWRCRQQGGQRRGRRRKSHRWTAFWSSRTHLFFFYDVGVDAGTSGQ